MFGQLFSIIHLFTSPTGKTGIGFPTDFRSCSEEEYQQKLCAGLRKLGEEEAGGKREAESSAVFGGLGCSLSFLQSRFWGHFKNRQGWKAHYFCGTIDGPGTQASRTSGGRTDDEGTNGGESSGRDFTVLVLSRSLLPRRFPALLSVAYIPFGPVFSGQNDQKGQSAADEDLISGWNPFACSRDYFAACRLIVQKLLGYIPLSCFFVRLDSNWLTACKKSLGREPKAEKIREKAESNEANGCGSVVSIVGKADEAMDLKVSGEADEARRAVSLAAKEFGFHRAVQRVQVPDTVLLDLSLSEEQLLAQMHKKHRYNIRLAQKKGVQIRRVPWREGLEQWYQIYRITAQRDRIGIHSPDYYRTLFEEQEQASESVSLYLYLAYRPSDGLDTTSDSTATVEAVGAELLAGVIVLHHCDSAVATYMYGASANEGRELMPNYLLQWQAIREARRAGMLCYDFFGVPPHAEPTHPLHGLYRFKVGFGGYLIQRAGAWDMGYSRLFYTVYRLLEYGRFRLRHLRHKSSG
ncbi:peptidoglycan bridge formation glycyltransferase FemA/FemB family protein [Candidatus Haliotispira prima]|uniref:Peptidoglycan bridge formation glycyltransferase FemA/FemB family protein n=1 Tax=Candidatus Haliotispira prima TaxID=3034016 RepID=A0ABY8MLE3_9SPIO|nr:peptidoglycan bridge formation glycyltransferase FemA/FemB family protein [Candidatus Haliotispira prima]